MVSFKPAVSPDTRKAIPEFIDNDSSKKRKSEEFLQGHDHEGSFFEKRSKADGTKSIFDMGLQLETPLPSEWQRCLDIQSGQIHFYNTRTQKRTFEDPRRSPSPVGHMSLDLQLNLPCDYSPTRTSSEDHKMSKHNFGVLSDDKNKNSPLEAAKRSFPSWLAVEEEQQEVVTVCMKCHMLVMLCKSSPSCPNCKFMHPIEQGPPELFKQRLSLLC